MMPGESTLVIRHCRRVPSDACSRMIGLLALRSSLCLFGLFVGLIAAQKFYRRKFMRAADEKLYI